MASSKRKKGKIAIPKRRGKRFLLLFIFAKAKICRLCLYDNEKPFSFYAKERKLTKTLTRGKKSDKLREQTRFGGEEKGRKNFFAGKAKKGIDKPEKVWYSIKAVARQTVEETGTRTLKIEQWKESRKALKCGDEKSAHLRMPSIEEMQTLEIQSRDSGQTTTIRIVSVWRAIKFG